MDFSSSRSPNVLIRSGGPVITYSYFVLLSKSTSSSSAIPTSKLFDENMSMSVPKYHMQRIGKMGNISVGIETAKT